MLYSCTSLATGGHQRVKRYLHCTLVNRLCVICTQCSRAYRLKLFRRRTAGRRHWVQSACALVVGSPQQVLDSVWWSPRPPSRRRAQADDDSYSRAARPTPPRRRRQWSDGGRGRQDREDTRCRRSSSASDRWRPAGRGWWVLGTAADDSPHQRGAPCRVQLDRKHHHRADSHPAYDAISYISCHHLNTLRWLSIILWMVQVRVMLFQIIFYMFLYHL